MVISKLIPELTIHRAEVFVFRAPIEIPVETSFGTMLDRPSVLVRVEDADGVHGWGEIWCNFPNCGAEHRARLAAEIVLPMIGKIPVQTPIEYFKDLNARLHILRIQTGEYGPLNQVIAGVDIALWDLAARKLEKPLYQVLGGVPVEGIKAYASGIHPSSARSMVEKSRREGFKAFKVKVGFDQERDSAIVNELCREFDSDEILMLDANQCWDYEEAVNFMDLLPAQQIVWMEEPMPADVPPDQWQKLASMSAIPLAGGENISGLKDFSRVIADGYFQFIQPDACKWGGITGCVPVAKEALKNGRIYCPHYLGGGIGLLASAHILAAAGGGGFMEIDTNPNPLQKQLANPYPEIENGMLIIPGSPGLGVDPNFDEAAKFIVKVHSYET